MDEYVLKKVEISAFYHAQTRYNFIEEVEPMPVFRTIHLHITYDNY